MQGGSERGVLELLYLVGKFPSNFPIWKCCWQGQCAGMHGIFGNFSVGMCDRQEPMEGGETRAQLAALIPSCVKLWPGTRLLLPRHCYTFTIKHLWSLFLLRSSGNNNNSHHLLNAYYVPGLFHSLFHLINAITLWGFYSFCHKRKLKLTETNLSESHKWDLNCSFILL